MVISDRFEWSRADESIGLDLKPVDVLVGPCEFGVDVFVGMSHARTLSKNKAPSRH